ncbi:MAG: tetratricopeptide repeat protein, partial [Chitinivibrionales bacterium]|nr:tetratricopeptide repeat protein [Chitinivibrionales bacterium]
SRETLTARLGSEWDKIGVLNRELANINDVLGDIRSFELYPPEVTHLEEKKLVNLDKKIEAAERRQRALLAQVNDFKAPLADAMGILREQIVGKPVEDMFFVIEQGDLERIEQMLTIKHAIDGIWGTVDSLLTFSGEVMRIAAAPVAADSAGFEREFFEIIRANLGMQSQVYYNKLNRMKDTLAQRATLEAARKMLAIETFRVRQYLKNNQEFLAEVKTTPLKNRFAGRLSPDELNALLARAQFTEGKYYDALKTIAALPDSGRLGAVKILTSVQSRYALRDYGAIVRWARGSKPENLPLQYRNILIWMTLESAFNTLDKIPTDSQIDPAHWAGTLSRDSAYAMAVLHASAKFAVARGAFSDAQAQYEAALKFKGRGAFDELTRKQVRLGLADLCFERGDYTKALARYFELLDEADMYDKALYGIIWCYIKAGNYQKAEISLHKLINQNPQSPLAVDAMLIMATRYIGKAQYEWKKAAYLAKEESGVRAMIDKIDRRAAADTAQRKRPEYEVDRNEALALLQRLTAEDRESYADIAQWYKKAGEIYTFVNANYKTGSLQEVSFSARREYLMHQLDSLLLLVRSEGASTVASGEMFTAVQQNRATIKSMVLKSNVAALEATIDRYRWEQEYADWEKSQVNARQKELAFSLKNEHDPAAFKIAEMRRRQYQYSLDSLVRRGDSLNATWQAIVVRACSVLVMSPLDSAEEAYFNYHWGEILYQQENEAYREAYRTYENAQAAHDSLLLLYRSGKLLAPPDKPDAPQLDHKQSAGRFRAVIGAQTDSAVVPAAHYSLAWCFNDQGLLDSAITHMQVVARKFPNSQFTPQAWMYIGEYCFDHGKLE